MDAAERALLEETVRDALDAARSDGASTTCSPSSAGSRCSTPSRATRSTIVFTALGATNAAATALDDVLASALGLDRVADLAVVLLPPFGSWAAPDDRRARRRFASRAVARAGRRVGRWAPAALGRPRWTWPSPRCTASTPTAGWHAVRGRRRRACGATALDAGVWETAVAAGRRAVAHQISGACRTMLTSPASTRSNACSSAGRSRGSRRCGTAWPRRWSRSRRSTRRSRRRGTSRAPMTAALAKASPGRTARTVDGALPAGARRHRLHDRPPVPPLPQARRWCSRVCSAAPTTS